MNGACESAGRIRPPGTTIGLLGGGQLGRMLVLAGTNLGYRFVTLDPAPDSPCGQVSEQIRAAYDDEHAARELAGRCDVITYEFENVDAGVAALLEQESSVPQGSSLCTQHSIVFVKSVLLKLLVSLSLRIVKSVVLRIWSKR